MSIETGRILGGIGALLMFIGIIPYINYFGAIELVGLILVMVALYNLAGHYSERGIFNNALYGLITGIVGGVISIAVVVVTVLTSLTGFLLTIFPGWTGDWTALSGLTPNTSNLSLGNIREQPLKTIIANSRVLKDLKNHRHTIKGPCGSCDQADGCYGCRGAAYQITGDYLASDPLCWRNCRNAARLAVHDRHDFPDLAK